MEEYRLAAQRKYLDQKKIDEEREEAEQKEKEIREKEAEQWLEQDQKERETVTRALEEWDSILLSLHDDTMLSIYMLSSLLESTLPLFTERNMMEEWKTRVVHLIERLNSIQENRTSSTEDVKAMEGIMRHMISLTGVDVQIETMDTTQDEQFAMQLAWEQEQQWAPLQIEQEHWMPAREVLDRDALEDENPLPVVSLTRRIGLTVPQLKELARQHGQKMTGTKEELSLRLSQAGWVRILH
jgi:hypothetical protein